MDLQSTYNLIRSGLKGCELLAPLEPFEHVKEVERLRISFRPENTRLLLFAESHVRVTAEYFDHKGAGFIYNHRYYTPWWNDLLLPALSCTGLQHPPSNQAARLAQLERIRRLGLWIVDASIVALSGYRKLGFEGRPFDVVRRTVIENSWKYVGPVIHQVLNQAHPPVICYFQNTGFALPEAVITQGTALKFRTQANSSEYRSENYTHGTAAFVSAVRRAGILGIDEGRSW